MRYISLFCTVIHIEILQPVLCVECLSLWKTFCDTKKQHFSSLEKYWNRCGIDVKKQWFSSSISFSNFKIPPISAHISKMLFYKLSPRNIIICKERFSLKNLRKFQIGIFSSWFNICLNFYSLQSCNYFILHNAGLSRKEVRSHASDLVYL